MELSKLSLKEKIGQMLMFAYHGTTYNEQVDAFVNELKLGGIISFARNIKDVNQIASLNSTIQKNAKIPLFLGLDQEGGPVLRVMNGITPLPGAMALASSDRDKIFEISKAVASDLKNLGFNMNFAPVGDINNNPQNPVINSRSYSDDPNLVAKCSEDAFLGFQAGGILPTMKHFPGHGNTSVDSHIGLPVVDASLDEITNCELIPFINAINKGIDGIMMSHILYKKLDDIYPSSLSKKIINDLLIKRLGFKGLIVTDSLTMGAIYNRFTIEEIVYNAVTAGVDILIFCGKADLEEQRYIYNTFINLVKIGRISLDRIDKSVEKILKLKEKYVTKDINLGNIALEKNNSLASYLQDNSIVKVFDNNLIPIKNKEKVLLLFPKINVFSLVDNENQKYETLARYMNVDEIIYDKEMQNYLDIASAQVKYDKIIMATYNITDNDYQVKLFNLLDKEKVIVVSLRSPYDILKLKNCKSYVCIFEATKEALYSLSKVLKGQIEAKGKLSIKL
jgi:beta-N-acetylhexosaminidase